MDKLSECVRQSRWLDEYGIYEHTEEMSKGKTEV